MKNNIEFIFYLYLFTKVILNTLGGKDLETRPQVGFATIVSKLETSESKEKWNYLLKNLIIFDRCVEAKFFLHDIKNLNLPSIEIINDA